ncbi:MAG TPA: transposase, partial [Candidatus Binataceae bacterium]|nr:transposase [Candidatus Binataceae bacterium]
MEKAYISLMDAKVKAGKPLTTQPNITFAKLMKQFSDETACKTLLRDLRWPDGVRCPRCGNPAVYDLPSRKWHWQCTKCAPGGSTGYRFSIIAGTIFENTNKPLRE